MKKSVELARANEKEVKALMDHLIKAFENYCNQAPEEVKFMDAFMAVHNFHCIILLDIERRSKMPIEQQLFWRKAAADTFAKAMENKPAFRQDREDQL